MALAKWHSFVIRSPTMGPHTTRLRGSIASTRKPPWVSCGLLCPIFDSLQQTGGTTIPKSSGVPLSAWLKLISQSKLAQGMTGCFFRNFRDTIPKIGLPRVDYNTRINSRYTYLFGIVLCCVTLRCFILCWFHSLRFGPVQMGEHEAMRSLDTFGGECPVLRYPKNTR